MLWALVILLQCTASASGTDAVSSMVTPPWWHPPGGPPPLLPESPYLPPLVQRFRPPQQTRAQATARANLEQKAKVDSEAARAWVASYLGGSAIREHLDASLHHYNGSQLLEMFEWEFEHLQLFHNAPVDGADADREAHMCYPDDTPLNITLRNGYLQQPCQRFVMGGGDSHRWKANSCMWDGGTTGEARGNLHAYQHFYTVRYGMAHGSCGAGLNTTLRQANSCMMFNVNNLCKSSFGNAGFGGITYVLNTKRLRGRLIFEPGDGGNGKTERAYRGLPGGRYPPTLGTEDAFLHLLQTHEELYNQSGHYKSIAAVLNRWWVPGTPNPGGGGSEWGCYFGVMTDGNVWLPEDVLGMIAKHTGWNDQGLWGKVLGKELQDWNRQHKRPLIWADGDDSAMLLDPTVDGLAMVDRNGHKSSRFTDTDRQLFKEGWINGTSFECLANRAGAHLHLTWPSWQQRHICEKQDVDATQFVLGVDGNNECVYWELPASPTVNASTDATNAAITSLESARWECLNDGGCVNSSSSRAVFPTEQACISNGCGTNFTCITDIPNAISSEAAYCLPQVAAQPGGASRLANSSYRSLDSCEKSCGPYAECLRSLPAIAYVVRALNYDQYVDGIYCQTQHKCDGTAVYQKGGPDGLVLYRSTRGSSGVGIWSVGRSESKNDCCSGCLHGAHILDNMACACSTPDAQSCSGGWRGYVNKLKTWSILPGVSVVRVDSCLPPPSLVPSTHWAGDNGGESRPGIGNYTSLDSCSKVCYPYWDRMTECLKPPSGGMPSAYAVCGTPFGVEAKTGIYIKTQHNCSGQPVYQKGGVNGSVLHRCRCPGSYDAGWCVSDSSQINDCSAARCPDHSDHFMDNAACQCVRPDAQDCNGQWRGLYDGDYWQAARFVTVVPVDPTRASEPYFLPGGGCQFGNDAPVFAGLFERLFAGLFGLETGYFPWYFYVLWVSLAFFLLYPFASRFCCRSGSPCRSDSDRRWWRRTCCCEEDSDSSTYQALDDETPAQIAVKLMLDLDVFMQLNTPRYAGLKETSRLLPGTVLLLPDAYPAVSASHESDTDDAEYAALQYMGLVPPRSVVGSGDSELSETFFPAEHSPTPPEGLLCAGCGMGGPGLMQQSLPGPSQSVARRVDHQLKSPLLHCGGGDDDNSSSTTSGSRGGLLPPSALVGGDGDGADGYVEVVELPGGSIINLQGEVSRHGASSPLGTEQTEQKKRVVNSTKSTKEYQQELQRRRARLRNLYCLVAGVGLAIALFSFIDYLTLPPPMTAMVKVINPDAKKLVLDLDVGCTRLAGCEVTAIYVRLNVSKTCNGAPIYQDKRGNVLYKCSLLDTCSHLGREMRGWCTGPAARIEDCCGGCCDQGDHYLQNFGGTCASATRPDLCPDANWEDSHNNFFRGTTVEFVQNAQ